MAEEVGPPVEFRRIAITVRERPIADAQGRAPTFPPDAAGNEVHFPLTIGAVIYHWAATRAAAAWFAIAHALLEDTATINALSASNDAYAQYTYLQRICEAIRNGYNCLNIVWWNDPIARALYRKWIAGLPFLSHGESTTAVFKKEQNYGGAFGWFVPDYIPAVLYSSRTIPTAGNGSPLAADLGVRPPAGILPRLTRTLFDRFYPIAARVSDSIAQLHRVLFVPSVGFTLSVLHGEETDFQTRGPNPGAADYRALSVEISEHVENNFWINTQSHVECPARVNAFPVLCDLNPMYMDQNIFRRIGAFFGVAGGGRSYGPNGQATDRDNWWNFRFMQATTEINPNVELPAAIGPAEYLPYLREWMAAVVQRTPEDAILDSRAFVVYQNYEMARVQTGGLAALQRAQTDSSADIIDQQTRRDPNLETAAQAVFAIGGALATATYGISALVGGAVGGALMIADSEWVKPVEGHGKDDLGRWKPVFDRAWLSGDGSVDPVLGRPRLTVPSPPSSAAPLTTGSRMIFLSAVVPVNGQLVTSTKSIKIAPPLNTPAPGTPGYVGGVESPPVKKSTWGWLAAGALALGAAAWKFARK